MTEEDLTVNTLGIRMSPTNTAPLIFYYQHSTIRIRRIQAPGSGRHDKLNYEKAASAAYFFAAVIIVSCVVVAFFERAHQRQHHVHYSIPRRQALLHVRLAQAKR